NNESLVVNLGSENGFSVLEMAEIARKITGTTIPQNIVERRPGDPAKLLASSKKAQELLNWTPQYSSAETLLQSMWDVYKKEFGLK
ncbi:MAG: UDP-glucose 4-epimerase GalE, partial [Leptospira sp.]|nr:UDP-glucose 4-epimerase GalE [Leptospira sp.]